MKERKNCLVQYLLSLSLLPMYQVVNMLKPSMLRYNGGGDKPLSTVTEDCPYSRV